MDPLSIARSAITIATLCKNLYLFLKKVRDGDPTVIALRKEIHGLETTVESVRGVADSPLVNALVARQWKNVYDIMNDCEDCVTSLNKLLGKPDMKLGDEILQRIWKQWKIGLKADDLAALQTQMASNRQNLTLSLQVIILNGVTTNVSQLRSMSNHHVTLESKIDEVSYYVQRVLLRETSGSSLVPPRDVDVMNNLQDDIVSARASALLPASSTETTEGPIMSDTTGPPDVQLGSNDIAFVESWLHNPLSLADDDLDDDEITPIVSVQQTDEPFDDKETMVTVTTLTSDEAFGPGDDDALIEFHAISNLRHLTLRAFKGTDYVQTERQVKEVIRRSELKYGDHYSWKDETMEMLIRTYCCRCKWNEAEKVGWQAIDNIRRTLGTSHPSFYSTASLLMRILLVQGKHQQAEELEAEIPNHYWNDDCYELVTLSGMTYQDAAERIKSWTLQYLLPEEESWKWSQVWGNFERGGITGWGDGCNLIHILSQEGCEAPLRLILDLEGVDLNLDAPDVNGKSALHLATLKCQFEIVRLLLDKKASVDLRTVGEQETALIIAARNNDDRTIELLLKHDAEIEGQDPYHYTALHRAAFEGATHAVRILLENGADVGKRGNYGWTPLHCAASHGYPDVVRILLDGGADAAATDCAGRIALNSAKDPEVVHLLQRHMPPPSSQPSRRWTWF